ncbi:MAG: sensor histidine kinase [Bryobacteraceae bacterium]
MNLENIKSRALMSWATVGLLAVLCLVLASLQYVWLGEISRAERARLQEGLQSSVQRLAQDFNSDFSTSLAALRPPLELIDETGRERAYATQWMRWRESSAQAPVFRRAGLAVPSGEEMTLLLFDETQETFVAAEWPKSWEGMRDGLLLRLRGRRGGPFPETDSALLELPRFARRGDEPGLGAEQEWLIVELDLEFIRTAYFPALIARHIGTGMPIHARVHDRFARGAAIFESGEKATQPPDSQPDASVTVLDVNRFDQGRRGGGPPDRGRGAKGVGKRPGGPPPPFDFDRGRWQLDVRYAEGSLDAIVARLRWRNLGISVAILSLMLLTAVLLVRFSRQQQQLAELQMNFVAGVSHELRTPLTVIRTAAYNLRGRVAANPAQVERYGTLIQDESEKLTALVEQVLRFSSARAGHAVGERRPVAVESVIEEALHSRGLGGPVSRIVVEKSLENGLPLVMADEMALKHAIQNLLDNAVKYGTENSDWIGVSAQKVSDAKGDAVEVRVADRGLGIPPEERADIFNPFFRGRRAQQDQIHGTGLGLNLVKRIVEAHDGAIRVESEPGRGTAFIIKIPAAPAELQDEFAHTAG